MMQPSGSIRTSWTDDRTTASVIPTNMNRFGKLLLNYVAFCLKVYDRQLQTQRFFLLSSLVCTHHLLQVLLLAHVHHDQPLLDQAQAHVVLGVAEL